MARYRFAPNGGAYSDPHGILSTLVKIRSTAKRDGKGYSWQPPNKGYTRRFATVIRLMATVGLALRKTAPGDLSRLATRVDELTSTRLGDTSRVYLIRTVKSVPQKPPPLTEPFYVGMPPSATAYKTPYGVIYCGGACKDDYESIGESTILGQSVKLQKPATDSYIAAAKECGGIKLTGSWRSCIAQTSYYNLDPNRYAPPDKTAHTRGLAIDIDQNQNNLSAIYAALSKRGWFKARPDDEPWHMSFGIKV